MSVGGRFLQMLHDNFTIPRPPAEPVPAQWIPPGQAIEIAGLHIPGGMVYVGGGLLDGGGQNDPCLINPLAPVAKHGDPQVANMGYWPRYGEISPAARRSYLEWLAQGRSDPRAYIGYVFLFFYGLERRVLRDFEEQAEARNDRQPILEELIRLRALYGDRSSSFFNFASELISWVSFVGADPEDLVDDPGVERVLSDVPMALRYAIGKLAGQGACLPATLAAAWALTDPDTIHGVAAKRCPADFLRAYRTLYEEAFGPAGLELPARGPLLTRCYTAASEGFGRNTVIRTPFRGVLSIAHMSEVRTTLRQVGLQVELDLAPFSRSFTGYRPPIAPSDRAAGFLMPKRYWSPETHTAFEKLKARADRDDGLMTGQVLLNAAGAGASAPALSALIRALASHGLGVEPDPAFGRVAPGLEEQLVLFVMPENASFGQAAQLYGPNLRKLQLYFLVASALGDASPRAMEFLRSHVGQWSGLPVGYVQRLQAHLALLSSGSNGVALAQLKRSLKALTDEERAEQAQGVLQVAQSGGDLSKDTLKLLTNIYKAMGLNPKSLLSDVYAVSTGGRVQAALPAPTQPGAAAPFVLDAKRIAALQEDSAKAAALLTSIFVEDDGAAHAAPAGAPPSAAQPGAEPPLMGLDVAHSRFARELLTQSAWSRPALCALAATHGLLPDGALEHINEAAFETFDIPFTEGEDPLEINPEILENLKP